MQTIYTFIISVFFNLVFYYLINYALIPWNNEGMVDLRNLTIVSISFVIAFTSFFSFLHQIVDKLFFRKFYEKPKLFKSLRRGFLIAAVMVSYVWLRLFGFWELHIILLATVLGFLLEALFLSIEIRYELRKSTDDKEDNDEDIGEIGE